MLLVHKAVESIDLHSVYHLSCVFVRVWERKRLSTTQLLVLRKAYSRETTIQHTQAQQYMLLPVEIHSSAMQLGSLHSWAHATPRFSHISLHRRNRT